MVSVSSTIKYYREACLRLFFPASCGGCSSSLEIQESGVCDSCQEKLLSLKHSPEDASIAEPFEWIDEAWALCPYQTPVREILKRAKFSGEQQLLKLFQSLMQDLVSNLISETHYDFLIPIPLDPAKKVDRGFNQAHIICRSIMFWSNIPIKSHTLRKRQRTPDQHLLTKEERRANLWGAFALRTPSVVKDKTILLVDDIFTTGATAEEAAKVLKNHGAKRVDLFTLAKTPAHHKSLTRSLVS